MTSEKHGHVVTSGIESFVTALRHDACFGCFLSTRAKRGPASHNVINPNLAVCIYRLATFRIHLASTVVVQAQAAQLHQTNEPTLPGSTVGD
jgi:hypothetical protein